MAATIASRIYNRIGNDIEAIIELTFSDTSATTVDTGLYIVRTAEMAPSDGTTDNAFFVEKHNDSVVPSLRGSVIIGGQAASAYILRCVGR